MAKYNKHTDITSQLCVLFGYFRRHTFVRAEFPYPAQTYITQPYVLQKLADSPARKKIGFSQTSGGGGGGMENLPSDVVLDIFSRLPIASFMQIKCVCRTWHAFVQNPCLPGMYHARSSERDPCVILERKEVQCEDHLQLCIVGIGNKDECSSSYSTKTAIGGIQARNESREVYVAGSCNGLLCVSDQLYSDSLYVFNPFTSEHIELPKPIAQYPNQKVALGFDVDPTTRECKIVRIAYFEEIDSYQNLSYEHSEVNVFTIGTHAWRCIGFAPWRLDCTPSEATVNGALHWVTRRYSFEPFHLHIISFDLANEQFKEIQRPFNCEYLDIHNYHLVVLRGCLSIAAFCGDQIEIWIMKEYNIRESWTKEYMFAASIPRIPTEWFGTSTINRRRPDLTRGSIQVLCILKSGQILLEYKNRGLLLYNPVKEDFSELIAYGIGERFSTTIHDPSPFLVEAILQK